MTTPESNTAQATVIADQRHALRPWINLHADEGDAPLVIARGEGAWLYDSAGKRYLDAVGGLWCTNIGLGRDEMADAIADQVRTLAYSSTFTDMTNAVSTQLAEKIASLTPGDLNRVHFTTGGSTAIDSAYRLMQFYQRCMGRPEKVQIVARKRAYHGSTFAAMSIGNRDGDRPPEFSYIEDGHHHLSAPDVYRRPAGLSEADYAAQLVQEFSDLVDRVGADKIGAFFAEPIMGSGGVLVPPEGYLTGIHAICRAHDILFVADEVVTAWGRLGQWFASEAVFGVVPDIIASAKGLTSGYLPLGAMIYSDRIHDVIAAKNAEGYYASGYTYAGHPVSCAAALKNIEIIEREDLLGNADTVGRYFEEQLATLKELPTVGDVRGMRMMMCVESVADKATKALFPDKLNIGKRISNAAEKLGLIVRPIGHLNIMSPPLMITRDDVDLIVDRLRRAIIAATPK
ncbi:aminotransferase [Yoonia sp. R2331]|uniref:aminotransferase n=1 Tax=Yoonia sp. R2331 TaxID=3237238 RepID=UPI0034E521AD